MRMMFIGSISNHSPGINQAILPEHHDLFEAARQLGYSAAARNHRVLVGSSSPRSVDYYIVEGLKQYCKDHSDRHAHVEAHYPEDEFFKHEDFPENLHVLELPHYADRSSAYKWVITHARAVEAADVVIALGGGVSTRIFGYLAADSGRPIVAIPTFGGSSKDLFDRLFFKYKTEDKDSSYMPSLQKPWNEKSAALVLEFAEHLVSKVISTWHTYFISYSWETCEIADHLEILLRRENRPVLRDESSLKVADRLSDSIHNLICACDTFICVNHVSYTKSSWCPSELEFALDQQHAGKKPRRVIALKVDDQDLPTRLTGKLYLDAKDRNDRALAVSRLVKEEE